MENLVSSVNSIAGFEHNLRGTHYDVVGNEGDLFGLLDVHKLFFGRALQVDVQAFFELNNICH